MNIKIFMIIDANCSCDSFLSLNTYSFVISLLLIFYDWPCFSIDSRHPSIPFRNVISFHECPFNLFCNHIHLSFLFFPSFCGQPIPVFRTFSSWNIRPEAVRFSTAISALYLEMPSKAGAFVWLEELTSMSLRWGDFLRKNTGRAHAIFRFGEWVFSPKHGQSQKKIVMFTFM